MKMPININKLYVVYEKIESGQIKYTNIKTDYAFHHMVNGLSTGYIRNWVDGEEYNWIDYGNHTEFFRYKYLDTVEFEIRDEQDDILFGDTWSLNLFCENFSAYEHFTTESAFSLNWQPMSIQDNFQKLSYRFNIEPKETIDFDVPRPDQTIETRLTTILYLLGEHDENTAHKMLQEMIKDYQAKTGMQIGYQVIERGVEIYDGDIESE